MTKNKKIFLGVLTFLPIVLIFSYIIVFAIMFVGIGVTASTGGEPEGFLFFGSFAAIFIIMSVMMAVTIGLFIYYIIHVTNNKKLEGNDRIMWVLVVIFAQQIGHIIYWYMKIWKEEDDENEELNSITKKIT